MRVPSIALPEVAKIGGEQRTQRDEALKKAALEFEGVLIKKMLESTPLNKSSGSSAYGSMILEAVSQGIQQGGGLGLSKRIFDMISQQQFRGANAGVESANEPAE